MTEDDLEELAKLANAASAAPWHVCFTNEAFMSAVLVLKNPTIGRVYEMYDNE